MIETSEVEDEIQVKLRTEFTPHYTRFLYNDPNPVIPNWTPKPCLMTTLHKKYAERVKNFKVRKDDIWIITYPKVGTTWTAEALWHLDNDLDFEKGLEINLGDRHFFLEFASLNSTLPDDTPDILDKMTEKRLIKSHLPVNLLPNELWTVNPKIIYVTRNAKDVATSYYHHYRKLHGYRGTLEDYLDGFLNENILYGSYFRHVEEFLELSKMMKNICILRFEDMKFKMDQVLQDLCKFLEKSYPQEGLKQLEEALKFENMSTRKSTDLTETTKLVSIISKTEDMPGKFMRKGEVGSFKDDIPEDYQRLIDEEAKKWKLYHNLFLDY